jgi:hypothetical protein
VRQFLWSFCRHTCHTGVTATNRIRWLMNHL